MTMTLLLRCVAPMQSWGTRSRFDERDTEHEPSKSGVIGLLCAALGRDRNTPLDDLAQLRMGVRVDREGRVAADYHTVQEIRPGQVEFDTLVSKRAYLADAAFLVGLEGSDAALLRQLHEALRRPVWPLFLGRKAFVPAEPIRLLDGLQAIPLEEALRTYPSIDPWPPRRSDAQRQVRFVVECRAGEPSADTRRDTPVSFALGARRFAARRVKTFFAPLPPRQEETHGDAPVSESAAV
ncbi:MAG: type I-E CRISPR-associated protein Cas5/CasD [Chloracidobacterium sp.]|nr:type I-E CRISPR-associated protein Cas5/CasD [Chloracidobacterium sp.]MDW8216649.1 type I-E CRISPR-associated protein Cas5/CasD [Acidobacteriota bacterium]